VQRSVLIVEDDLDTCEALAEALREEGLDARCVENGLAALDTLRGSLPSVILLDMMLPGGLDGWDVLRIKAADPKIAAIPVIAMSAHAQLPAVDGVVAVLRKPFDWTTLMTTLEDVFTGRLSVS
jgi:CheY-like chemotaxis protein